MKIMRSMIRLVVVGSLMLNMTLVLDAMEVALEDTITVALEKGETVVISKKEWECLKNACSVPIGGLNNENRPTLSVTSREEFEDLRTQVNLLASIDDNHTSRMRVAYNEYSSRVEKEHAVKIEALNVVANDPQLRVWQRNEARQKLQKEAVRYVALQEKKKEYEARFESDDEHLASLVNLSLFCTFLAQKEYDRYIGLLMQADFLEIKCILNDLDALLEITSAALTGEDVSACPPFVFIEGYQGNAINHVAVRAFLQALLALPCVDVSKHEGFSRRILLCASKMGYADLVKHLLDRGGISANLKKESDESALILATRGGHDDVIVLLLLSGAEVDATNSWGHTPLMLAAIGGYVAIARMLLARGASIEKCDCQGDTALSHTGHLAIARLLLERGARADVSNLFLSTPLMAAVENCVEAEELVDIFIENGASLDSQDILGNTALILASGLGKTEIVRSLLTKGARGAWGIGWLVSYFTNNGAQVNLCNKQGITALMNAARKGHADIVALLLEAGALVEAQDQSGFTALIYATQKGYLDIVNGLLQAGARAQIPFAHSLAVKQGHTEIAELLISFQVDSDTATEVESYKPFTV